MPELSNYFKTVEIPTEEYKSMLEAAHREELMKRSFDRYTSGTSYSDAYLDGNLFTDVFSLLYPEDYKRIYNRCIAEHEAKKNE